MLLALDSMPDFIEANGADPGGFRIQTLQEHSLTGGIANEALVEPLLLAIPHFDCQGSTSLRPGA